MKRNFGLDLIRTLATILVLTVHTFAYQKFYTTTMDNFNIYLLTFIRNISFICVPLFMLLTGYCKANKKVDKNHYSSIKKILITYLIISLICIPFRRYYLNDTASLKDYIIGIFRFNTNNYAWYVEMYIGLFLVIPFINIMYNNIETKKQKKLLILLLIIISSLPITLQDLTIDKTNLNILPSWWCNIYPLLYYVIGLYIKEYQPKIKSIITIGIILISLFLQTTINYLQSMNSTVVVSSNYHNIFTVIISTSVFLLLYSIKIKGNIIRKIMGIISTNSFGIYLFTYIFDSLFYKIIKFNYSFNKKVILSMIIIVPLVFMCSFIYSVFLNKIIDYIEKIISKLKEKHNKKYQLEKY